MYNTYELGVLKGHRLVTGGPYAVVRHPAYTAFIVAVAGILCAQLGPGSYVLESGWLERGLGENRDMGMGHVACGSGACCGEEDGERGRGVEAGVWGGVGGLGEEDALQADPLRILILS